MNKKTKFLPKRIFINNRIRAPRVRLIGEDGKQLGVFNLEKALEIARNKGLDLIQVTERVEPPVCKIGDYGKFVYQEKKKELDKERKKILSLIVEENKRLRELLKT